MTGHCLVTANVVMHSDFHVEEILSVECQRVNVELINRMFKPKGNKEMNAASI